MTKDHELGYSSCDIFSSEFQDNRLGTVFGEDGTTGAGGAWVLSHSEALVLYGPKNFKAMPFSDDQLFQAARVNADATVSFGLGVRANGYPIEDYGVVTDSWLPPTLSDLLPGANFSTQYDRVIENLFAKLSATSKIHCKFLLRMKIT